MSQDDRQETAAVVSSSVVPTEDEIKLAEAVGEILDLHSLLQRRGWRKTVIAVSDDVPSRAYVKERNRARRLGYKPKIVRMSVQQVSPILKEYVWPDDLPEFETAAEANSYDVRLQVQAAMKLKEMLCGGSHGLVYALIVSTEFIKALGAELDDTAWNVLDTMHDLGDYDYTGHYDGTSLFEWNGSELEKLA